MRIRVCFYVLAAVSLGFWEMPAYGALGASATISSQQIGSNFEYSVTLTNTGDTPIGTFWFGWVPLFDLLPNAPVVFSPPGWSGVNAIDYYGVGSAQWVNTTSPLQSGQSLSGFRFDSPDSPDALRNPSIAGFPVLESYVYIGAPETDLGYRFEPTFVAAPEPASLGLLLALPMGLLARRRH